VTTTESDLLKHALVQQGVFVQGELQARPGSGPLLCPAPLPEFDPALVLGTLEVVNTEGQYSAWIMFDTLSDQRLPDEAAMVTLGWHGRHRDLGPGVSTFLGDTPGAKDVDPGQVGPPELFLHPETRTVLFVRNRAGDQDRYVTWQLDVGQTYEHLSQAPRPLLILPMLRHPAGTSVTPISGTRGQSDTLTHSAESILVTWLGTATDLHAHYAVQLVEADWVGQLPEPSGASSTWSFEGGAGQGSLTVQRLADGRFLAHLTALRNIPGQDRGNFGLSASVLHRLGE